MDHARIAKEETPQALRLSDWILNHIKPKSIVDFGCSTGLYLKPFVGKVDRMLGIDIDESAIKGAPIEGLDLSKRDLTEAFLLPKPFDLGICLEVAEHINSDNMDTFFRNIADHCDTLIFSAAIPGQGGDGHINCRPKLEWIKLLSQNGFHVDIDSTSSLIAHMKSGYHLGWFIKNAMVLRKISVKAEPLHTPEHKICESRKFRFHVFGLAHLPTRKDISPCAYTQKIFNLCKMLKEQGNTVYFYGVEGSDVSCDENVTVLSEWQWKKQFGHYDWRKTQFDTGDGKGPAWNVFRINALKEVQKRLCDKDFVLLPQGHWHRQITDQLKRQIAVVESGIGYRGIFARFRVFESYAWMHYLYGLTKVNDGHSYDTVIPNYYDKNDFAFSDKKEDFCLFVGRLVARKGIAMVVEATKRAGRKLVIAGQVTPETKKEWLKASHVEYVGVLGHKERNELMARARCFMCPTQYIEPFGGVAVEASANGTPVISSDHGAFTETVLQGITGFRCVTLNEFVHAIDNADKIKPATCRKWFDGNFELSVIGPRYQHYFDRVYDLWEKIGIRSERPQNLDPRLLQLPCSCHDNEAPDAEVHG